MKLIFFKPLAPVGAVEHGMVYHCGDGFWRDHVRPQRCSAIVKRSGTTATGRPRTGMCSNQATYATYTGEPEPIHRWVDPLCTQHHKKRTPTPTEEK